jgi:hypothetical protein
MKSHEYAFRPAELARALGGPLVPVVVLAALLRLGAWSGVFPAPWPALDMDHTILTHQAQASRTAADADLLLLGDSSCLMDVAGQELETALRGAHHALNLGTFMYVGFDGYAALLSHCASAQPGRWRAVVLLVHPEMLRGVQPVSQYLVFLSDYYAGADYSEPGSAHGELCGLFGLDVFRDRFLSRIPLPLPKEYGRYYGFNLDLYAFMDRERGSAVDPRRYAPGAGQGNAEYWLAASLQPQCRAFRAAVPAGAKLLVGLTPVPESFAPRGYPARWQGLLAQFGQWIGADVLLTNLPPTLPDACFASTSHLNPTGASRYARTVAQCVLPVLE